MFSSHPKEAPAEAPAAPTPLPQQVRLVVALAALAAVHDGSSSLATSTEWYKSLTTAWIGQLCKLLDLDRQQLPPTVDSKTVSESAEDQKAEWSEAQLERIAGILVEASLAAHREDTSATKSNKEEEKQLRYTPLARALSHRTLSILGLPAKDLLPPAENTLSRSLFTALKAAEEDDTKKKVESTREKHSQGWGGSLGRKLATGAGVVAGGVLIGVTGGLAAPAIAALLAPLGIGGLLAGGAAPVVLGTLFGVGGGGLAGKRVSERWKGVEEFGFVEVGAGTKITQDEVRDLQEARARQQLRSKEQEEEKAKEAEKGNVDVQTLDQKDGEQPIAESASEDVSTEAAAKVVNEQRAELEETLLKLSTQATTRPTSKSEGDKERISGSSLNNNPVAAPTTSGSQTKPPSLTATIIVPGLLTVSKTEAITAWRAICSDGTTVAEESDTAAPPPYQPRVRKSSLAHAQAQATASEPVKVEPPSEQLEQVHISQQTPVSTHGLKDGRDVYLLRFETDRLLQTGRDIDFWVTHKLKMKLKSEIIKRTVLNAYFAAVKLPLSVYSMATMGLDNTWMRSQDKARKAGRILGEVIEQRVQGERPVVLIGSSLGALTVFEALLYLASLPPPAGSKGLAPTYVESAFLISLPAAPTKEEWEKVRGVTARRVVNAYSDADFVLAGVVRLHEVVSRATTLSSGLSPAGLGPVEQVGVQDIDVSSVLRGHMELQAKMGDIIKIIDIDG